MKDILKICLVQTDIVWQDKEKSFKKIEKLLGFLDDVPDLIILPEMFSTGFTMQSEILAENETGESISWMRETAKKYDSVITGSIIFRENNKVYNRLIWMPPSGVWNYYDKRHLFTMGGETENYHPGTRKLIIPLYGWKVCPLICYDLRFPVWSRNAENYDLLIYVANWPEPRRFVWDTLLIARALENQSYVCGINRTGVDGNNVKHNGGSVLIDPKGKKLITFPDNEEKAIICNISLTALTEFRKKFPVLNDRDNYLITD